MVSTCKGLDEGEVRQREGRRAKRGRELAGGLRPASQGPRRRAPRAGGHEARAPAGRGASQFAHTACSCLEGSTHPFGCGGLEGGRKEGGEGGRGRGRPPLALRGLRTRREPDTAPHARLLPPDSCPLARSSAPCASLQVDSLSPCHRFDRPAVAVSTRVAAPARFAVVHRLDWPPPAASSPSRARLGRSAVTNQRWSDHHTPSQLTGGGVAGQGCLQSSHRSLGKSPCPRFDTRAIGHSTGSSRRHLRAVAGSHKVPEGCWQDLASLRARLRGLAGPLC